MTFRPAMITIAVALSAWLVACGPAPSPGVDTIFSEWDQTDGPGCAVAVARQGELVYSQGYGFANLDHGVPITPRTVFDVASITKQFIAAGLTVLEREGRLSLDDDVRRWLPELPAYGEAITLRHMLHHSSGLRDYLTLFPLAGRDDYTPISKEQILNMMVRQRALASAPGEQYDYSNSAYMLLAQVLERAVEQPLGRFMREQFFEPLGMDASLMYEDLHRVIPRRATGHGRDEAGNWQTVHNPNFDVAGDGQLYTTVEDLLRWDQFLHGPASELHGAMTSDGALNDGEALDYARGIVLGKYRGLDTVGHSGSSWGFRSQLLRFVEPGLGIAVACNADEALPGKLAKEVADHFLADQLGPLEEPEVEAETETEPATDAAASLVLSSSELRPYVGRYYSPELDVIYRIDLATALMLRIAQEPAVPLEATARDEFEFLFQPHGWSSPSRVTLAFRRDSDERVAGFSLSIGLERNLAFLRVGPLQELPPPGPMVIVNARVIDGSGAPAHKVAVRIVGDRIEKVGGFMPEDGDTVIDAAGLVLAPGFIDTHSHHEHGLRDGPAALAAVSQGITTIAAGQDGSHDYPLSQSLAVLEQAPPAINVASYVGHGTLRSRVMGDDYMREATDEEVAQMVALLQSEMAAGALGLTSGLEYDPGSFSSTAELVELARATAAMGGRYVSHIRSEDQYFWEAIDEAIHIGREANIPVRISHVKLAMTRWWGQAGRLLGVLDAARASGVNISADLYPYPAWNSDFSWLATLFPERDLDRREGAEYILSDMLSPEGILLPDFAPNSAYNGLTIAQVAQLRESDPESTLMALLKADLAMGSQSSMLGFAMSEPDIEAIMAWPHTVIGSDGELQGPHPRGFGAFTRVLGHYVREQAVVPLEEAIRKMTWRSAQDLGIEQRGLIQPGYHADLVLFDPATVNDHATSDQPHVPSVGISRVWVNGQTVWNNGQVSGNRPGRVIRRNQ